MTISMNIEQARLNMIEQQIRPWEVLDPATLETIAHVKREAFVPFGCENLAFSDLELPLTVDGVATGELMFSPKMEARLLQELSPKIQDTVFEIGSGSGYMAALLAARTHHVQTWEINPLLETFAKTNLAKNKVTNVVVMRGDGFTGINANKTDYDLIVLSGAVEILPQALLQRLRVGGRMTAIVGQAPVMSAILVHRSGPSQFDQIKLFETLVQPLVGCPHLERFRF